MFALKDKGFLSRDEGWEHGITVAESVSCDYRSCSPAEGPHQFKDVVRGTRVTGITGGPNLKHFHFLTLTAYVHVVGYDKWKHVFLTGQHQYCMN